MNLIFWFLVKWLQCSNDAGRSEFGNELSSPNGSPGRFLPQAKSGLFLIALAIVSIQAERPLFAQLLAAPPQPWPNSRPITFSFAPDFVEIGRFRNELFSHMDGQMSHPDWQIEIARAMQAWSRYANVQFARMPDSPRAFGVPGLSQSDPRFGDVRFGAFPQVNVLGNAVPFNYGAGTWSGDIFFDTTRDFYIHQWGDAPDWERYDLFSVALHEIGNSLGLIDDELDPDSVMFFAYVGPRSDPSPRDIQRVQDLYGARLSDPYEPGAGNDDFQSANRVELPANFSKTLQVTVPGEVANADDVDFYRIVAPAGLENCWLKLRAKGKSLLCGRVTAYGEDYQERATASAESPFANNVAKEITGLAPGEAVYVAVDWSGVPDFEFGEYELVFDWNPNGGPDPEDTEDDDDEFESERFWEAFDQELVDQLYAESGLIDRETTANNTFASAVRLLTSPGAPEGSRFEMISAIASPKDQDMYLVRTSATSNGTMAIQLSILGLEPAQLEVLVFDSQRIRLPVQTQLRQNGDLIAIAPEIRPNSEYFVRIQNKGKNTTSTNYVLEINIANQSENGPPLAQVQLSSSLPDRFGELTIYKTQLFRVATSVNAGAVTGHGAQLTIYSDTGRVELVSSTRANQSTVAYVWLQAGTHYFRLTAKTQKRERVQPLNVILDVVSVSDDEGPVLIDPSGNPVSGPQQPGINPTPPPTWGFPRTYVWLNQLALPPDNPWF